MDLDLTTLDARLSMAEAAAGVERHRPAVIRELDRLAEHLIGESAPQAQQLKVRIQQLIAVVAQDRSGVTIYVQAYCHVSRL